MFSDRMLAQATIPHFRGLKALNLVMGDVQARNLCGHSRLVTCASICQVLGDSNEALPKFRELNPLRSFDILYIDGGHHYAQVLQSTLTRGWDCLLWARYPCTFAHERQPHPLGTP